MEIYVHVPFCVKKCNYCDFLSAPADDITVSSYVNSLIREIRHKADLFEVKEEISSVYFGGGTPSVLNEKQIGAIIEALRDEFPLENCAEITIEVNPKTVDKGKLEFLKKTGFNRLSIGMQSTFDDELKMLGRIHTYDDFIETFTNARDAGFMNINVDVMTALPGQDEKKLNTTLKRVVGFNPEHISAYSLIIEPGTPFYEKYGDIEGPVVGEELERKLYWQTVSYLEQNGYSHYEISNFSKKGFESRHNCGYWTRVPYLGVGLGASSCLANERTRNEKSLSKYLENPFGYCEVNELSQKDIIEEYFYLGLRMTKGVDLKRFSSEFGMDAKGLYKDTIKDLKENGLISEQGGCLALTDKGTDYGNYVFSRFLLD